MQLPIHGQHREDTGGRVTNGSGNENRRSVMNEQDMRQSISQWLAAFGVMTPKPSQRRGCCLKDLGADLSGYRLFLTSRDARYGRGCSFLKKLDAGTDSALPVIMITGHGDVPIGGRSHAVGRVLIFWKSVQSRPDERDCKGDPTHRRLFGVWTTVPCARGLSDGSQLDEKAHRVASPVYERLREDILWIWGRPMERVIDG